MGATDWLADTRTSYDTVAESYADQLRDSLADKPYLRAVLGLFADLVGECGGGPVADVGCGPGHIAAYLNDLGLDVFGIDLSPAMVRIARRDHPGLRFEVGTMTALDLTDGSVTGLLAWWSLVHVPDDAMGTILAQFRRVLRPGGVLMLGFHVGAGARLKTEGYGGHPMNVYVYRRSPATVGGWLRAAGFTVTAGVLLDPQESVPGAVLVARAD